MSKVAQGGQTRIFNYDSLSRLTSARNPESGNTSYDYDSLGNLVKKTDARGIAITYSYDSLQRLTGKSYSDSTPAISYSYDKNPDGTAVPYGIGHLTQVSNEVSTTNYTSFDPLGAVTDHKQVTQGQAYSFHYEYNLMGSLVRETLPSGRVLTTGYDAANRPAYLQGSLDSVAQSYIGDPADAGTWTHYAPSGNVHTFAQGNGIQHASGYNARLQPTESYEAYPSGSNQALYFVSCTNWGDGPNGSSPAYTRPNGVPKVCPDMPASVNNGNLRSYTELHGGGGLSSFLQFDDAFEYDALNRLTRVTDTGLNALAQRDVMYTRVFSYDRWGNMAVPVSRGVPFNGNTPTAANSFDPDTNRLLSPTYDEAGNQRLVGSVALSYDAEARQVQSKDGNAVAVQYRYDGNGQRVLKVSESNTSVYVYDALGQLASEYSSAGPDPNPPCTVCYYGYDHLGSVRLITNETGAIVSRHDYLPFGEEIFGGQAGRTPAFGSFDSVTQRFTGKEADAESGLHYFGARYFSGPVGRFTSPDEVFADQDEQDPQSWNLYSYVRNNPLRNIDSSGQACSSAKGLSGETIIADLDGTGCAALHDNTVHGDEPGLLMLAGVGESLTNPHNVAQFVSDAGRSAASFIAPVASSIAECITPGGNCSKGNLAMAMLPHVPGLGNVGEFVTGQVVKRVIQTPEGSLVLSATVEVVGDTIKLKAASLTHADGVQVVTNPGPGTIKAAFDSLKGELRQAGFAQAQVTALRISGANSPRLINKTFNLR